MYQLGTEDRRPRNSPEYIAPSPDPYETIVFRAMNVKDLSVDDVPPPQPAQRPPPNDPAVLSSVSSSRLSFIWILPFFPLMNPIRMYSSTTSSLVRERKQPHVDFSVAFLLSLFF